MMNNKVLIKLIVPELDSSYDVFIPVNETISTLKKLIIKSISDINNCNFNNKTHFILINKYNSRVYLNSEIIIDTDIRNASEILFISFV